MSEDYYSTQLPPARKSGGVLRAVLGSAFLAFLAGAALVGWAVWDGRLALPGKSGAELAASPDFARPNPAPGAHAAPQSVALLEQQIATLEQRLARIELQAAAAEGNSARAEALLVVLAARRAIERGAPLGYLEDQLRLRFSAARPAAVNTVIEAAKQPVTLIQLAAELEQLGPELSGAGTEKTVWSRFRQQMSGLFVVHRDAPGASDPQNRVAKAQLALRTGQVDAAIELIAGLSGGPAATNWVARARRYAGSMAALDQIEQAALAEPEKLKAGTGESVRQPGPGVSPSPTTAREATF
jgi:hypothetical protein